MIKRPILNTMSVTIENFLTFCVSEEIIYNLHQGWGIVACPVIQTIGRPEFEDDLRTRSPGEVVSDRLSIRTSSMVTLVSILG